MGERKPYHSCPPRLWCPACGRQHDATPEARAQAERADAAWEKEVSRG